MPFHVRITTNSNPAWDEIKLDVTELELETRFLQPYREGRPIVVGGRTIPPDDIQRIRINLTTEQSQELLPLVIAERRASSGIVIGVPNEWYIADRGEDVTDKYITGPPGSGIEERTSSNGPGIRGPKVVFVVHGRDMAIRDSMFMFLRSISLEPLEWTEALVATGRPTPYIGEILDTAFGIAQAIVVLMTPDDVARLHEKFIKPEDPPHETQLTPQCRPNVLFEAGMAIGRNPDRTILVQIGETRPFSDISGLHTVRLNNSSSTRQELARRLQVAGCPANISGTDWHQVGNFEIGKDGTG